MCFYLCVILIRILNSTLALVELLIRMDVLYKGSTVVISVDVLHTNHTRYSDYPEYSYV